MTIKIGLHSKTVASLKIVWASCCWMRFSDTKPKVLNSCRWW